MIEKQVEKKFLITSEGVVEFARLSHDKNPIHLDEDFASKTPFKQRIAHGLYVGSFISSVIANDLPGPGTIYLHQSLNFRKPVFIGDTIIVSVKVLLEKKPGIYELETLCRNQKDEVVVDGNAIVKAPH